MARTLEKSLLEQVQALKSKIDEVMTSHTDKDNDHGNFMQSNDHTEPDPVVPQVVVDIHEQPKYEDKDKPSVEVVQADRVAQVEGMDEHGAEGRQTADDPTVIVPEPKHPETKVKQLYTTEMSPADKNTYSTGDSPQILKPRSPIRARVFPQRQEARVFKGYYPESLEMQYSPIKPRANMRPEPFPNQRRGMT